LTSDEPDLDLTTRRLLVESARCCNSTTLVLRNRLKRLSTDENAVSAVRAFGRCHSVNPLGEPLAARPPNGKRERPESGDGEGQERTTRERRRRRAGERLDRPDARAVEAGVLRITCLICRSCLLPRLLLLLFFFITTSVHCHFSK